MRTMPSWQPERLGSEEVSLQLLVGSDTSFSDAAEGRRTDVRNNHFRLDEKRQAAFQKPDARRRSR